MTLNIGLLHITSTMLRYIPSIPSFTRTFIMKKCWILSKVFSCIEIACIEMIVWVLSSLVLICCITFKDLHP
jgi:hypothetical protein